MSNLAEVTTYKNKIMEALLSNDNIVKALGNDEPNFLDSPVISNPKDLLFTRIFPYKYIF